MESHKTLLMSYLWTKMSGFKTVFPCDNSLSHFFFSSILTKKKEFYLKLLDYLIGTQHILEAIFSIKTSGEHIFIDFKRVMSTSLLHFLKNKLFIVSTHFVNPRNHIFR